MNKLTGGLVAMLLCVASVVGAADDDAMQERRRILAGFELGLARPVDVAEDVIQDGVAFNPFVAWMFNRYIGMQGQVHLFANNNKDRPNKLDDDTTWVVGGTAGPRVAVPWFDPLELWGAGQAGVFTGLAPHSAVTDTSFGFSAGAGLDFPVTERVLFGGFGRYNRLYQRVHGLGDAEYVTAGIMLMYDLTPQKEPPPPPPVVQASPPPPPPPTPQPTPVAKKKIVLRGVNFDFDKATIRPDARPVLDEAISVLKEHGDVTVVGEGHTDSTGPEAYNQQLSERRARAVRDYLIQGGISAARIEAVGYGENRPVASNETRDGRAQNRRVELKVRQ